ncbi:MAG TPA: LytTR family DNA-binding domain-containing protein [Gemmatimonadaceae bacterium]|nr:LytTR family DNA-binding domain-containing protein [Gemmatimonadaceae bacterium]
MKTRVLIVEDEPIPRERLRELLSEVNWIECVGQAPDGRTAIRMIDELRPDLVFLDIEMPGMTGLEVLTKIEHDPAIVFTTAYDRYAVTAFELEALDYLLKPFGTKRLDSALERVKKHLQSDASFPVAERARVALETRGTFSRIFVRDRGRIVPIQVESIDRLEAEDDYVGVHSNGRRYLVYLGMAQFEARLDPEKFVRIHRSHIVNLDRVAAFLPEDGGRLVIEMKDGTRLAASRTRSRELRHLAI